jgi:hypothetical protein
MMVLDAEVLALSILSIAIQASLVPSEKPYDMALCSAYDPFEVTPEVQSQMILGVSELFDRFTCWFVPSTLEVSFVKVPTSVSKVMLSAHLLWFVVEYAR